MSIQWFKRNTPAKPKRRYRVTQIKYNDKDWYVVQKRFDFLFLRFWFPYKEETWYDDRTCEKKLWRTGVKAVADRKASDLNGVDYMLQIAKHHNDEEFRKAVMYDWSDYRDKPKSSK